MTHQMVRADPGLRRLAAWLVLGATVLGTLGLAAASTYLRQVTSPATMRWWLWGALGLASGGGLAFGCYLARMGYHVLRVGQFPVPGQRVVRDTPVRQGRSARQIAWLAVGAAVLMWVVSLALPLLLWSLLRSIGD
jgi:hypothetical protein